jgi:aldehyde:ferredoxin oxidoreductase
MPGSMYDRMVRIHCGKRRSTPFDVPGDVKEYIGGMGYGTKIMVDEVQPAVDPLSEANKIIITVGPLTGTNAPLHPQTCIVTKSPLTRTILNCYAGGFLGAEIKFSGIDGIILEGASPDWTIIFIENGQASFHSAENVMGKGTLETESYMKDVFGKEVRTMSIGRAGENLVSMASIFSETRAFGRGGAGAVLGSKKIKGIAVRGTLGVSVAEPEEFRELAAADMENLKAACAEEYNLVGMFSRVGTGAGMGLVNGRGALATRNHEYGSFKGFSEIDGYAYAKKFYTRPVACFCCPVHCGMLRRFKKPDGSDSWLRGPEYETMFSLGSDLMIDDPVALAEANQICEEYGMDTLTVGVTVAWALEMAEAGTLKENGLLLRFGDSGAVSKLLRMIGDREGIGDLLARGPGIAAEKTGGDTISKAMQVKNSGFAAWMPRRMKGVALAFATSNRGACHKRAPIGAEITGQVNMNTTEGKAVMVKEIQDKVNAIFTLVSCRFHEFVADPSIYPAYVNAATGRSMTPDEFITLGERIWNLEKLFNLGAGLTRADDSLPGRCFEPVKGEHSEEAVIKHNQFESMLDEYYKVRGWTEKGIPSGAKLQELGIEEYVRLVDSI